MCWGAWSGYFDQSLDKHCYRRDCMQLAAASAAAAPTRSANVMGERPVPQAVAQDKA